MPVSLPQRPHAGQAVLASPWRGSEGVYAAQGSKWRRYTRQEKKERPQPLSGSLKRFYRSAPPRRWKDSKRLPRGRSTSNGVLVMPRHYPSSPL